MLWRRENGELPRYSCCLVTWKSDGITALRRRCGGCCLLVSLSMKTAQITVWESHGHSGTDQLRQIQTEAALGLKERWVVLA